MQTITKNLSKTLSMDTLRAFSVIADVKSITLASELLNRSQPAVSLQLKKLEANLQTELFARDGKRLTLTAEGARLLPYASQILRLHDQALEEFGGPQVHGSVRFGIPSEFATTLMPNIVAQFAQTYPHVALEVSSALSKDLLASPADTYDLILALAENPKGRKKHQIRTDPLVWVTSKQHQPHALDEVPLIVAPPGCIYRKRGTEVLNQAKQPWRIVYTIPDLSGIKAAIEAGLGVTVLAKSTVPDSLRIMPASAKFPALGKVGISLIPSHEGDDTVARLMEYVKASLG